MLPEPPKTPIDSLINRHKDLTDFLEKQEQVTFKIEVDEQFTKILILSISSYFEHRIIESLNILVSKTTPSPLKSFIEKKAIARQYHTYFAWRESNINQFLGLFGEDFKKKLGTTLKFNSGLKEGMEQFMKLGNERNELIHQNLAESKTNWTLNEVVEKYEKALPFVNHLTQEILSISNFPPI